MATKNSEIQTKGIPIQFSERIANLFLVCLDGLCLQIPEDEFLHLELKKLGEVIEKVVSRKKVTDLGQEIQEYFKGASLEKGFREAERQVVKEIVLDMASSLQGVLEDVGSYDQTLDECIEEITAVDELKDIALIKDRIVKAAKKSKSKIQAFKMDLQISRKASSDLSEKLKETQSKVVIDSLTRILNRSAYDMRIAQTIHSFHRSGNPVCLIIIDIDNFKIFNDTHGHKAGDKVLCSIAATMKNSIRASDQIFRYGGEEFVVLLYDSTYEIGVRVAEKIRSEVKRDFFVYQEKELKVTISLGVAVLHEGDTEESVFERADKAMYEAKRNGRDRVEVSPEDVPK